MFKDLTPTSWSTFQGELDICGIVQHSLSNTGTLFFSYHLDPQHHPHLLSPFRLLIWGRWFICIIRCPSPLCFSVLALEHQLVDHDSLVAFVSLKVDTIVGNYLPKAWVGGMHEHIWRCLVSPSWLGEHNVTCMKKISYGLGAPQQTKWHQK